jgi:ATP-binding cassette, subfamily B, bacterial PglK
MDVIKKITAILSPHERKQAIGLVLAILIIAFIDVTGVASVLPFMSILANPEIIHSNEMLAWAYKELGFSNTNDFILTLGCIVLTLMLCSTLSNLMAIWIICHFTRGWEHSISKRLLTQYIYQPYSYFLEQNTSNFIKNLHSEITAIITCVFVPGAHILARSLVACLIVILLIIVNPFLAIILFLLFGGAYFIIYRWTANLIDRSGKNRVEANRDRFKISSECLKGIKDVKILGKERSFIEYFSGPSERFTKSAKTHDLVGQVPRLGLEAIAFGGLMGTILYHLSLEADFLEILPILSIYAIGGYRLMPALNTIYSGFSQIRFHLPSLDIIYSDLNTERPFGSNEIPDGKKQVALSLENKIELRNLTFYYSNEPKPAVNNINLAIEKNSSVAFVGPTGSGKTTTIDMILGLLSPSKGKILVNDIPLSPENLRQWQNNLGYVPQHIHLFDESVARNISFCMDNKNIDMKAVKQAARIANLHNFICNDLKNGYDTVIGEDGVRLSGGQRQRIGIARALYRDPGLLVLDEATSALDGVTENAVMEAIHNLSHQKTIITIAHRVSTVKECDIIYLLEGGIITAKGTYEELIKSNSTFQKLSKLPNS